MFRALGRFFLGAATAAALVAVAPREAGAWLKFHNDTDYVINVAHAYSSSNGQFCGYFDSCEGTGLGDWRVKGWWVLDPDETNTVQTEDYDNAYHQYFAFDSTSTYFWQGGGSGIRTQNSAFSYCANTALGTYRTFKVLSTSRCCGLGCDGPTNKTINLVL